MINSWPLCSACALRKIPSGLSSSSGRTTQEGSCPARRTDPPMLVLHLVVTQAETCVTGFEISLQFYTQLRKSRGDPSEQQAPRALKANKLA